MKLQVMQCVFVVLETIGAVAFVLHLADLTARLRNSGFHCFYVLMENKR